MTLSPDDIVNYPLKQSVRGYSVSQVDELLDQIADTIEQTEAEIADLRQRLETSEERLASASETEATLKRTLVTAQRAAEQSLEEAKQRAAALVDDARREAAAIVEDAKLEAEQTRLEAVQAARAEEAEIRRRRQAIESHIEALRVFERDYRSRLRTQLDEQLRILDEIPTRPPDVPSEVAADGPLEPDERQEEPPSTASKTEPDTPGPDATAEEPRLTVRVRDGDEISDRSDDATDEAEATGGRSDRLWADHDPAEEQTETQSGDH